MKAPKRKVGRSRKIPELTPVEKQNLYYKLLLNSQYGKLGNLEPTLVTSYRAGFRDGWDEAIKMMERLK